MPNEAQARAMPFTGQSKAAALPGGWLAVAIAALSALLFGFGIERAREAAPARGGADASSLAEVSPEEFQAALNTVAGTPEQLAQLRDRSACSRRLAWVTLRSAPGQTAGRIRLKSGGYISPPFAVSDVPVRIALPYPSAYETGQGIILVIGTTTAALVALTPPWQVPAQARVEVRKVVWTPIGACSKGGK